VSGAPAADAQRQRDVGGGRPTAASSAHIIAPSGTWTTFCGPVMCRTCTPVARNAAAAPDTEALITRAPANRR